MKDFSKVHFIGIGGVGMSGIALVLSERGIKVTGSDLKESRYVRKLRSAGIDVTLGHLSSTIEFTEPDVVVTSSAIHDDNPELVRARELGIEVWQRAKMLSWLSSGSKTIAVTGTHGKTTTSSMIAEMLDDLELDPSFLIGGTVEKYATNAHNGSGDLFVCEADESDASFLFLNPYIAVVTNVEKDHMDHYGNMEALKQAFVDFMNSVGEAGIVVCCGDDKTLLPLAKSTGKKLITYGFDANNDFVCEAIPNAKGLETKTKITHKGESVEVTLHANPGIHNQLNATAAIAVAAALDIDLDKAADKLSNFKGVGRRFTHVGDVDGICVVDDYAHHPTEIKATLKAASSLDFNNVVVVFQPHRYSRTQNLLEEFTHAFKDADKLIVMDIFAASELPIPGVSGKNLADAIRDSGEVKSVEYASGQDILDKMISSTRCGDLLITMGAGDVTILGPEFISKKSEE